jgi:Trk K+ transport system NAD-binding subunit
VHDRLGGPRRRDRGDRTAPPDGRAAGGGSLRELDLRKRSKISVVAIRREVDGQGRVLVPVADDRILPDDILVVVAPRNAVQQLLEVST